MTQYLPITGFDSFESMENDHYHLGNTAQSRQLLKELLPTIESLILNASKEFYSVKEAMQVLSISRTQLYYLRRQQLLSFKRVGRKVYISRQAIHELVMNDRSDPLKIKTGN